MENKIIKSQLVKTTMEQVEVEGFHLIERKSKTLIGGTYAGPYAMIIEHVRSIDDRTYKVTENFMNGYQRTIETNMTEDEVKQFEDIWSENWEMKINVDEIANLHSIVRTVKKTY